MQYNFLKDNIIVVCSNDIKTRLIKHCVEKGLVFNIKYMTKDEFIKKLTFRSDEKTIVRVMDEFHLDYLVAKNYLDNVYYLLDEKKEDKRIKMLLKIREFCVSNGLFKIDSNFKYLIDNKDILFVGYDYINHYELKILNDNNIKYNIIKLRENVNDINECLEFETKEDEVFYLAEEISKLIDIGININKIFVANVDDDYNYLIKRIFKLYGIPFNANKTSSLYESTVGKYFLNNLDSDLKVLDEIKNKFNNSNDIVNKIIDVLNKFCFISDFTKYKSLLIYEFKNTKLECPKYNNAINIIDLKDNVINDDEYVFLVGFNLNVIPKIIKNEDYFSDEIKFSYMENTREKNILEKSIWKNIILSIKNLKISFSLSYLSENFYVSPLVEEMGFVIIQKKREISKYSDGANKLLMGKLLDDYYKFGIWCENLEVLLNTYSNGYNSYDNRFKKINYSDDIVLSYSSINTYYKCAFKYYLANVLRIDIYNENFSQYVGNLFHWVLQQYYLGNSDIDGMYECYLENNKYNFKEQEKFFINILKDEMHFIINTIDEQNELSNFKDLKLEEKMVINYGKDVFKGFVDKILYKDNNLAIVDYKTGSVDIDLSLVPFGLSLQLPVYLFLAKSVNKDANVVGFYLQYILNSKLRHSDSKRYEYLKKDALKLQGYSLGNASILEEFDSSFKDSRVIKGMKMGNNGFYHYSKVLSKGEMERLYDMVDLKIKDAFKLIKSAKFDINPKIVKGKNVGCEFCKFKDICFMTEKDKVYLEVDEECKYLRGDENA